MWKKLAQGAPIKISVGDVKFTMNTGKDVQKVAAVVSNFDPVSVGPRLAALLEKPQLGKLVLGGAFGKIVDQTGTENRDLFYVNLACFLATTLSGSPVVGEAAAVGASSVINGEKPEGQQL